MAKFYLKSKLRCTGNAKANNIVLVLNNKSDYV